MCVPVFLQRGHRSQVLDIGKSSWEVVDDGRWAGNLGPAMERGRRQQLTAVHNSTVYSLKAGRLASSSCPELLTASPHCIQATMGSQVV